MAGTEEYKAKLVAELKAEIARLQTAVDVIEGRAGGPGLPAGITAKPHFMRGDEFHGMGILDAARKYLGMTGRTPKSSAEIAEALEAGGIKHKSANFRASVNTILSRDGVKNGVIEKLANGMWGLPEWYKVGNAQGENPS